jgi:capsular exopolysaccharide synthesis family protein
MAKMLDALERARQERLKKMQAQGGNPIGSETGGDEEGLLEEPQPASFAAPPAEARSAFRSAPPSRAALPHNGISELVIGAHDHQSPIVEQARQIRTNLETILADYRSRTLVVSSPITGDGKTLVTANLAIVLADSPEQQVILVDADMRKGMQHSLFGCRPGPGLAEYLSGQCTLEEATYCTSLPNLKIIPAGRIPEKPTVLIGSERMSALVGELQRTYRWILFDSPPLLPVTDAVVLARECIGLVMVIRMGRTNRSLIERAQDLIAEMRVPVLGCILNDFDSPAKENAYYYSAYRRQELGGGSAS